MIPEEIKKKIKQKYPGISRYDYHTETEYDMVKNSDRSPELIKAAEYGYSLAQQEIEMLKAENEKLRKSVQRWQARFL